MWFLIKSSVSLVAVLAEAYVLFFVDLGGKPLAGHIADVWGSQTVQAKVALVKDGVRNELEDRLARVAEQEARKAVRRELGPGTTPAQQPPAGGEDITPEDQQSLDDMLAAH